MTAATTKGKIEISKLNLMGFTPETQVFFIQNGGGRGTYDFLQSHRNLFDHNLYMGQVYYALPAARIEKFKAYAMAQGFEVVEGGTV